MSDIKSLKPFRLRRRGNGCLHISLLAQFIVPARQSFNERRHKLRLSSHNLCLMVNKRTYIKFDTGRDYFFIGIFGKPGEGARFAKIKGEETKGEDSRKTVAAAACCYIQLESRQLGEKLAKGGEILFAKQTGKTTMAKLLLKRKRERERPQQARRRNQPLASPRRRNRSLLPFSSSSFAQRARKISTGAKNAAAAFRRGLSKLSSQASKVFD